MGKLLPASALLLTLSLSLGVDAVPGPKKPTVQGGNNVQTTYQFKNDQFGANDVINLQNYQQVQGGQTKTGQTKTSRRGLDIHEREAYADPEAYPGGVLSGGDAKGGDSRSNGGNRVITNTQISHSDLRGSGNTFNLQNQQSVSGGNLRGGNGGPNSGSGGQGGSLSIPSPYKIPRSLYARNAYAYAEPEAFPGGFLSGGDAKGGSSNSKGGNTVITKTSLTHDDFRGSGNTFNLQNQQVVQGGDVRGGNGGANGGRGGGGGQLSISRRDLYERDAEPEAFPEAEAEAYPWEEVYAELYARNALPEAEPEAYAYAYAEPEFDIYERDAYAFAEPDMGIYERDAYAYAEPDSYYYY